MDCKFRAQLVEGPISQTLAAAPEQHTLHNYSHSIRTKNVGPLQVVVFVSSPPTLYGLPLRGVIPITESVEENHFRRQDSTLNVEKSNGFCPRSTWKVTLVFFHRFAS